MWHESEQMAFTQETTWVDFFLIIIMLVSQNITTKCLTSLKVTK